MKNIKTMEEIEEYLNDLKNYNTKDVEKFNSKDFKIIKYRYNTNGTLDIWENVKFKSFKLLKELPSDFGNRDGDNWHSEKLEDGIEMFYNFLKL